MPFYTSIWRETTANKVFFQRKKTRWQGQGWRGNANKLTRWLKWNLKQNFGRLLLVRWSQPDWPVPTFNSLLNAPRAYVSVCIQLILSRVKWNFHSLFFINERNEMRGDFDRLHEVSLLPSSYLLHYIGSAPHFMHFDIFATTLMIYRR